MNLGKVGLHLRTGRTQWSDAWVQNSGYAKALDDVGLLAGAPGLKSLRLFIGDGNQQWQSRDPVAFADQMISVANNSSIILEPTNECGQDDLLNYIAWIAAFTSHAHSRGYRVAGFSFAVGNPPDLNAWVTIAQHGFAGVDYLAQHCYWNSGPPFDQYTGLRWQVANTVLAAAGFSVHPPWLLTEIGWTNGWEQIVSAESAAATLVAFMNIIATDPTVAGAAVFTRGGAPDFANFETDPIAQVWWGGGGGDPCAGVHCNAPLVCQNGQCVCPAPYQWINGVCQMPAGDPCAGVHCNAPEVCQNGVCVCPAPYQWINGVCQMPSTDPCAGVYCLAPQVCLSGACICPSPYAWINGVCQVPPIADPCAALDCVAPLQCEDGRCVCLPPFAMINGVCQMGGGGTPGLDAGTIVAAALVGSVIAGTIVFLRRQVHHPTPVRTAHELGAPVHRPALGSGRLA